MDLPTGDRKVGRIAAANQYWFNPQMRSFAEECGVFGVYAPGHEVARRTYFALYTLQHRGQESSGIAVSDGTALKVHKRMGLVSQVYDNETLSQLTGDLAIGHNRYSTTGSSRIENAQPIITETEFGPLAVVHNGNLTNARQLRSGLLATGQQINGTSDTELILALVANAPGADPVSKVANGVSQLEGSFSLVFMTRDSLIAVRDRLGNRPLCLGRLGDSTMVASESCAFATLDAHFERDVQAGEIVVINDSGTTTVSLNHHPPEALCLFEYIYFARPDSDIEGVNLYKARQEMGRALARQDPVDADLVIGIPDSATAAAIGYAEQAGIPYGEGLAKSRYIGRTFIEPDDQIRKLGIKLKLNALPAITAGKRLVVVDDSIVRGNTTREIVRHLKQDGKAAAVHMRISSPPVRWPCFYGVDISEPRQLIAHAYTVRQICESIGADSLSYLSLSALIAAVEAPRARLCTGCFTHDYPVPESPGMDRLTSGASGLAAPALVG